MRYSLRSLCWFTFLFGIACAIWRNYVNPSLPEIVITAVVLLALGMWAEKIWLRKVQKEDEERAKNSKI